MTLEWWSSKIKRLNKSGRMQKKSTKKKSPNKIKKKINLKEKKGKILLRSREQD
jgi:hypothetical protein